MSTLLYGVGALAVVVGVVMIGFGVPVNEFSFGNTLIISGVTAVVGGLIVIGLGVVATQLQRVGEMLAMWTPIRPGQPDDMFQTAPGLRNAPGQARAPFPPKPKLDTGHQEPPAPEPEPRIEPSATEPAMPDLPLEEPVLAPAPSFAPMLRNPEEPPVTVEDDVSLTPPHPMAAMARGPATPGFAAGPADEALKSEEPERFETKLDVPWRPVPPPSRQPPPLHFDAMWPEPKSAKSPAPPDLKPTSEARPASPVLPRRPEPEFVGQHSSSEPPRSVAILKSGVVDGMGYTLYVDGSIEAELPQGTLRFASINELRAHLEKNS